MRRGVGVNSIEKYWHERDISELKKERAALVEALEEVMEWVDNTSPRFLRDYQWADTDKKVRKVLKGVGR